MSGARLNNILRRVALLGPSLSAVSGVSTHLNVLLGSRLVDDYNLMHFQVGSEGRNESKWRRMIRLLFSPIAFAIFLLRHRPEIVHLNTSLVPRAYWRDYAYLCVAKLLGRRVVNQIHGGALPEAFAGNLLTRGLLRGFFWLSDTIVVLSSEELHAYHQFAPVSPIHCIPNTIRLTNTLQEARVATSADVLRLIYVGRIARAKGLFDALAALRALRQNEGLNFEFRLVGYGPDENELRDQIVAFGLQDAVQLLGPVFGEEKDRLWLESDVFVFPTASEGLPYALLESMAAGCVPLTCSVGAIPDVMQEGVQGIFVPVSDPPAIANALRCLARDCTLLSRLSQAARERIADAYTVEQSVRRFVAIYKSLER